MRKFVLATLAALMLASASFAADRRIKIVVRPRPAPSVIVIGR